MTERLVLWLLIAVCGALIYLDWQRQGAIEDLYLRVDRLDAAARKPARARAKPSNGNGGSE